MSHERRGQHTRREVPKSWYIRGKYGNSRNGRIVPGASGLGPLRHGHDPLGVVFGSRHYGIGHWRKTLSADAGYDSNELAEKVMFDEKE